MPQQLAFPPPLFKRSERFDRIGHGDDLETGRESVAPMVAKGARRGKAGHEGFLGYPIRMLADRLSVVGR
jgi:hypothetical protein